MAHDVAELLHLLWRLNDKDDVRQSLEEPSAPCADIATLAPETTMPLSPMLRARFAYAGAWDRAAFGQTWPGLAQIAAITALVRDRPWHVGHVAKMSGAFPLPVGPSRIALYGLDAARGDATYLVWCTDTVEPAVCAFYGGGCDRFLDLSGYLAFLVGERSHDDSAEMMPGTSPPRTRRSWCSAVA